MAKEGLGSIGFETGEMGRDQSWEALGGVGTQPLWGGEHDVWLECRREGDGTHGTWR